MQNIDCCLFPGQQGEGNGGKVQLGANSRFLLITRVVPSVQSAVMVAHGVEVIQVVAGNDGLRRLELLAGGLLPRVGIPLHHVGGHVHSGHWEAHQRGQLVPPLANLFQHFTLHMQPSAVHTPVPRAQLVLFLPSS